MNFTASDLAVILRGEIEGNPEEEVSNLAKIEEGERGSLTFLSNPKYTPYIYSTNSSIVIVDKDFNAEKNIKSTLIRVDDSRIAFSTLLEYYDKVQSEKTGVDKSVSISDSAEYGDNVYLGSFSYLGENVKIGNNVKIYPDVYVGDNVVVGDNTIIYSGVKLYSESVIGRYCKIHSGAVIGADGFGFAPNTENEYSKMPQIGNAVIEDFVEIGALTTIDRATLGSTVVGKGVKLDNQIQVGHNVVIGENTVIAAQTGIAGSTTIGKNCLIGGQVGIVGHIKIGDYVKIAAQSGVISSLKEGEVVQGSPAMPMSSFKRAYVYFRKLSELVSRISNLEKENKQTRK